jgi:hypothetical protein
MFDAELLNDWLYQQDLKHLFWVEGSAIRW